MSTCKLDGVFIVKLESKNQFTLSKPSVVITFLRRLVLKPFDTFWTEQKLKVHRFTNNLQGLQKVMVKDFPWNIIPWNALLFEKTLKQLSILDIENNWFILNTSHDTEIRAETRVGFPVIFSRLRWPIDSIKFHRFVILYISYDTQSVGLWTILITKSVQRL